MPELRWILIGFALVLLAGIYLWGRRNSARETDRDSVHRSRPEPTLLREDDLGSQGPAFDSQSTLESFADSGAETTQEVANVHATIERKVMPTARASTALGGAADVTSQRVISTDTWRGRIEPTFVDSSVTVELPVEEPVPPAAGESEAAPTLSSSETPATRRPERRKILALRLAASPHRIDGSRLLEVFETETLRHGKYGIYHRLHDDGISIFSVASMVEPGTFDPERMAQTQYSGITMFAQLPGPVAGMHALNELIACARRLQQSLGGTLQDDRGVPLTVHRIERMRQEVREFERPPQNGQRGGSSSTRI